MSSFSPTQNTINNSANISSLFDNSDIIPNFFDNSLDSTTNSFPIELEALLTCNPDLLDILSSIEPVENFTPTTTDYSNNILEVSLTTERTSESKISLKRAFDCQSNLELTPQVKKKRKSSSPSSTSSQQNSFPLLTRGVKINKLLELLTKDQLKELLLRLVNEEPSAEKKILSILPSFDLQKSVKKAQRLLLQIREKFPRNTKFASCYDHYTYLQVKPYQNLYISFVLNQLKSLYEAKQFHSCLSLLIEFIELSEDLPNWDADEDRLLKFNLYKNFASTMLKIIKKLKNELDTDRWIEISEISCHFNTPSFGGCFSECYEYCQSQLLNY